MEKTTARAAENAADAGQQVARQYEGDHFMV
jgi:hypothetical protein